MHQDGSVERIGWQPRIVRLTKADHHVLQSESAHSTAQALQIFRYDIYSAMMRPPGPTIGDSRTT
jgi:hypothetical protein